MLVEVEFEAVAVAVDDAVLEALLDGPVGAVFLHDGGRVDALEDRHQLGQRVVAVAAAVVHEVERELARLLVDLVHRHDARRMHDGGIEAGFAALVEEHAVQHVTDRRLQPEADVRQSEDRRGARELRSRPSDRLDGLDAVASEVFGARTERERQHVEDEVSGLDAVAFDRQVVDAFAHLQLPVGGAGLALFVDGETDHRGAVLTCQRHHAVEALPRGFALLEVRRVEDGLAAGVLQPGFEHRRLGRVEHQGQRCLRREPAGNLVHVGGAITPDVVDAHVEHVSALLDLVSSHLHTGVPVGLEHGVAKLSRTVGVGPLADREVRELLVESHRAVDRRTARFVFGGAGDRCSGANAIDHGSEVRGRRSATSTDDVEAELVEESRVRLGQGLGRQVVVRVAVDDRRQPRVGQTRQKRARVLREVTQVLGHLGRTGRGIETDHVGAERLERSERGADLRPHQQTPGRFDRHLHHDGYVDARRRHRAARADDGGLALEQVLHRLDEEHVGTAGEQTRDHRLVVVAQLGEGDVPQRRQAGSRADRADDEPGAVGGRESGRDFLGQARRLLVDGVGLVGDAVLVEHEGEGAECGSFDRVDAGLEVLGVHPLDEFRPGQDEALVTPFERRSPEVVRSELLILDPGPERAVEDEHSLGERVEEFGHSCQGTGGVRGVGALIRSRSSIHCPVGCVLRN